MHAYTPTFTDAEFARLARRRRIDIGGAFSTLWMLAAFVALGGLTALADQPEPWGPVCELPRRRFRRGAQRRERFVTRPPVIGWGWL